MSYFDISKGAKVTITAKKKKRYLFPDHTDLKVKIKGGEDYSNCIVPLLDMSCDTEAGEEGSYCYIGDNKWCDNDVFNPHNYCAKCMPHDSTDCEEPTIDCDSAASNSCHDTEIDCGGSVMVKMHRVDVSAGSGYIDISAYSAGSAVSGSINMHLLPDTEVCFNDDGNQVSPGSPDCKLDIYLEEIDKTVEDPYKSNIIRGCYNR